MIFRAIGRGLLLGYVGLVLVFLLAPHAIIFLTSISSADTMTFPTPDFIAVVRTSARQPE